MVMMLLPMVIPERKRRTDNDGFLSKTLYGALEHNFTDAWSGFVRGYGYDNRTNYDAYYSRVHHWSIPVNSIVKVGTPGCDITAN